MSDVARSGDEEGRREPRTRGARTTERGVPPGRDARAEARREVAARADADRERHGARRGAKWRGATRRDRRAKREPLLLECAARNR